MNDAFELNRLAQKTSEPDWDGEGAPPIPAAMWEAVRLLLSMSPVPRYVAPCGDCTIHIEWATEEEGEMLLEMGLQSWAYSLTLPGRETIYWSIPHDPA